MARTDVAVIEDLSPLLLGDELPEAVDPEEAARDIMRRILEAPDLDSVFDQAGTISAEDVIGKPLRIRGFKAMKSAYEEGANVYFLIDAVDGDTGEVLTINCGARNVMAQLYRAGQLDGFPLDAAIVKARKATAAGYYPLWLERVS